jgi:hypothetical protein
MASQSRREFAIDLTNIAFCFHLVAPPNWSQWSIITDW